MNVRAMSKKVPAILRYMGKSPTAGIPLEVFLILTNECNYRCQVCSLWKGIYQGSEKPPMNLDEIRGLIDECSRLAVPTFLISGGEPLLHPHILEITDYAVRKLDLVRMNTNASLITEEVADALVRSGLHELWVSLDGIGRYFDEFRGVENAYERTVAGLRQIQAARERHGSALPRLLVDTIVTRENRSTLPEHMRGLRELSVDEVQLVHTCYVPPEAIRETEKMLDRTGIYSGQFSTEAGAEQVGTRLTKAEIREIRQAISGEMELFIDPLLTAPPDQWRPDCRCLFPWMNIMVFTNGEACVCPLMDFILIGNVREQSLMEIWNSETMQEIRNKSSKGFPLCRYCICTRRVPLDHLKHRQTLRRIFR